MVELLRHRQTKEAGTDMFDPKATASHLDSTKMAIPRVGQPFRSLRQADNLEQEPQFAIEPKRHVDEACSSSPST